MMNLLKWGFSSQGTKNNRFSVVTSAVNLPNFTAITDQQLNVQQLDEKLTAMVARLPEFTDSVARVPDPEVSQTAYDTAVENNNRVFLNYMKNNMAACLSVPQQQVDMLFRLSEYKISGANPYTQLMARIAAPLSRYSKYYMKACAIKQQVAVEKRDRYSGLSNVLSTDITRIDRDVRKINYERAEFSKQTSTADYINNTSPAQKRADLALFKAEIAKASKLARIVSLTIEDIPETELSPESFQFTLDPKNRILKRALDTKFKSVINRWVGECKTEEAAGRVFDLDSKLKSE